MVVIRLSRGGSKKKPFYNIVAADRRAPRDGRFIERLGYYNPVARGQEVSLHLVTKKYQQWLEKGAQPSPRVVALHKLYLKNGEQNLPARLAKISKMPVDDRLPPAKPKVEEVVEEIATAETDAREASENAEASETKASAEAMTTTNEVEAESEK